MKDCPIFAGMIGGIQEPETQDAQKLRELSGLNSGNFLFVSALRRILSPNAVADVRIYNDFASEKARYAECADYIAIPAANWIQPGRDLEAITSKIESLDLPTLVVGLGAQAEFGGGR